MKLIEMSVENFRSIKNCHVTFGEVNAVIGENNAGKTALLRALNSVFNWKYEEPFFLNNSHQYSLRAQTKISLIFEDAPENEVYMDKAVDGKLTLLLSYSYSTTKRRKYLYVITKQDRIQVDDSFLLELKKDIDYVYVPAGRGNKELLWSEESIFGRTLAEYSKSILQNRDTLSVLPHLTWKKFIPLIRYFSCVDSIWSNQELAAVDKLTMDSANRKSSRTYIEKIRWVLFGIVVGVNIIYDMDMSLLLKISGADCSAPDIW